MVTKSLNIDSDLQDTIDSLIVKLTCSDFAGCQKARDSLVQIGKPCIPSLIKALEHPNQWVRWEAAKALGQIGNASCIEALARALEDESSNVRWVAAGELVYIGHRALVPLLKALIQRPDSVWLREGARNVIRNIARKANTDDRKVLNPLLEALDDVAPSTVAAPAAWQTLEALERRVT